MPQRVARRRAQALRARMMVHTRAPATPMCPGRTKWWCTRCERQPKTRWPGYRAVACRPSKQVVSRLLSLSSGMSMAGSRAQPLSCAPCLLPSLCCNAPYWLHPPPNPSCSFHPPNPSTSHLKAPIHPRQLVGPIGLCALHLVLILHVLAPFPNPRGTRSLICRPFMAHKFTDCKGLLQRQGKRQRPQRANGGAGRAPAAARGVVWRQ